jgi:hypothetical protein
MVSILVEGNSGYKANSESLIVFLNILGQMLALLEGTSPTCLYKEKQSKLFHVINIGIASIKTSCRYSLS